MQESAYVSLFEVNMGATRGERIVVFCDTIRPDETVSPADAERRTRLLQAAKDLAAFAGNSYGNTSFVTFPATTAHGAEPPEELWRRTFGDRCIDTLITAGLFSRLLEKQVDDGQLGRTAELVLAHREEAADVVIALSNNSTSHTRFRSLTNVTGTRFASLPNFDPEMFGSSMQVDWLALAARTARLAKKVNRAVALELETPNGTRMLIGKAGRTAKGDDGLLTAPGSFGNLPAGEVYLAPVEGTSEGVMVIEYAPTRKLAAPLELVVRNGRVTEIRGDEPHRRQLEAKFAASELNRNIAELGIGTNDRATRPDNILEAEKILGTVHIALGDNAGFGGTISTPFHEDYVFYAPTLHAVLPDGSRLLLIEGGNLQE